MALAHLVYRVHALRRMFERTISDADVRQVLTAGTVIEDYPTDTPYPSYLMLGFVGPRPIHVVAADNVSASETVIITVYEPDPAKWDATFRIRRAP